MNTKAQISDIDLTPDVDLTESRLDILPYKGIMDCNSPHVGGVLNNVYKKKIKIPDGYKLIGLYNGRIYARKPGSDTRTYLYDVTDYDNPQIVLDVDCSNPDHSGQYYHCSCTLTGNKITDSMRIGVVEQVVEDNSSKLIIYNPYFDGDKVEISGSFDSKIVAATSFTQGGVRKMWVSILKRAPSPDFYIKNIYEVTSYNDNILSSYIFTSGGHTKVSNEDEKFLVLGGGVYVIKPFFDTIRDSETCKQLCIDNSLFYMETEPVSLGQADRWLYLLLNDARGINPITTTSTVDIYPAYYITNKLAKIPIGKLVDSDVWDKELIIGGWDAKTFSCGVSTLLYSGAPVCLVVNNRVLTYDVSRIFFKDCVSTDPAIYYVDNSNNVVRLDVEREAPSWKIVGDYIISDSVVSRYNAYNMRERKVKSLFAIHPIEFNGRYQYAAPFNTSSEVKTYEIGAGEFWSTDDKQPCLNFPPISIYTASGKTNTIHVSPASLYYNFAEECHSYWSDGLDCKYYATEHFDAPNSFGIGYETVDYNLNGLDYPLDQGNVLYPVPMESNVFATFNNEFLVKTSEGTFFCTHRSNKNLVWGYYIYTLSEADNVFVLQSGIYGIIQDYIYSLQLENSVLSENNVVCNKTDLLFLGTFPLMAFFWAELDKSIYVFTGDNNLKKLKEAYRINTIGSIYCDPARLTMFISTDIGLIVLYQEQVFLLDYPLIEGENKIYYDNERYIVDDDFISFSPFADSESLAIKIKTEFYGESRMIKSVNDCVFVRITKNDSLTSGTVKIKAYTLTEKTSESTEQIYSISEKNFDISGQCLLQYQPQFQTGVGFAVELESDFPIAYMGISHQPEAIQQAPKGKQNVIATPMSKPNSSTFKFE